MSILTLHYANKQTGIILVTVLLFLQILSLLGLYALQNGFLLQMVSHEQWQKQMQFQKMEDLLRQIERSNTVKCYIPRASSSYLLAQSLDWWQSRAECTGKTDHHDYYYTIEALGDNPCAYLDNVQTDQSAYYFRVTVLLVAEKNQDKKQIMQSTMIKMDAALRKCESKLHRIHLGRQMWRSL